MSNEAPTVTLTEDRFTDFTYNSHGVVVSPSGHPTADILNEDRVAVLVGFPVGFYLLWVGMLRDFNPYLCWAVVTILTLGMVLGLRITRLRLVDADVKAHGYDNLRHYRAAAAAARTAHHAQPGHPG